MNEIPRHWCLLMTFILKCTKYSGHVSDRPLPLILTQMVDYQQTVFQQWVVLTFIACRPNLTQAAHIKSALNRNCFSSHLFDNRVNLLWGTEICGTNIAMLGFPHTGLLLILLILEQIAIQLLHLDLLRLRQSTCAKWKRSLSHVSLR